MVSVQHFVTLSFNSKVFEVLSSAFIHNGSHFLAIPVFQLGSLYQQQISALLVAPLLVGCIHHIPILGHK